MNTFILKENCRLLNQTRDTESQAKDITNKQSHAALRLSTAAITEMDSTCIWKRK